MTTTETVSGRAIPRYHGPPIVHDLRFYGDPGDPTGGWREAGLVAECEPCNWRRRFSPGHTISELHRLARQHAGSEDP